MRKISFSRWVNELLLDFPFSVLSVEDVRSPFSFVPFAAGSVLFSPGIPECGIGVLWDGISSWNCVGVAAVVEVTVATLASGRVSSRSVVATEGSVFTSGDSESWDDRPSAPSWGCCRLLSTGTRKKRSSSDVRMSFSVDLISLCTLLFSAGLMTISFGTTKSRSVTEEIVCFEELAGVPGDLLSWLSVSDPKDADARLVEFGAGVVRRLVPSAAGLASLAFPF